MADHIGGIAILDRRNPENISIYCFGFRDNKPPTYIHLPLYHRDGPAPKHCAWAFDIQGDKIHVTPSVRQMAGQDGPEIFHNSADWTVQFRDAVNDAYEELKAANPGARDSE